jgi:GT2 family glycosyltransferase
VSKNSQYIFFLDDDVLIKGDYFEELKILISQSDVIGGSGLAINLTKSLERRKPEGLKGLYKKIFLLDSKVDGKLLKSAINIPCRIKNKSALSIKEVDWLIGCSVWKISAFDKLRFEETFYGQSLGEDLLFSYKAKALGKLLVNTDILINHRESDNERPNEHDFYKMWILNRYEISKQLRLSPLNIAFHWANFGTLMINIVKRQTKYRTNISVVCGIINGYKEILSGKI